MKRDFARADSPARPEAPSAHIPSMAIQISASLFLAFVTALYAFFGIWGANAAICYSVSGLSAAAVALLCLFVRRLYVQLDFRLLLALLVYSWLSSVCVYGWNLDFFRPKVFFVWTVLFAVYCVIQAVPDPKRLLGCYAFVSTVALSISCFSVLFCASSSLLFAPPRQDTLYGCFRIGRLCGFGNANYMGFACTALLMVSLFGFFHTAGLKRFFYLPSAGMGWFLLGMANCRTGIVGVSFSLSLFVFFSLQRRFRPLRSRRHTFLSALLAFLSLLFLLWSFSFPMPVYRWVMAFLNRFAGNPNLARNLLPLGSRPLLEDDGTLTDRTLIWARCFRSCFKNLRRALFGITQLSSDAVSGVYDGRHDILISHAHNACLETLRRYGLIGFSLWFSLFVIWCRDGFLRLFRADETADILFFLCCAAGILLMSVAEPIPLAYTNLNRLDFPFLLICGYCVRARRSRL